MGDGKALPVKFSVGVLGGKFWLKEEAAILLISYFIL